MLISTPCHPKANSYVSYEELEDALSVFDWWEALTPKRKENAAILAASAIDAVPYIGRKLLLGQRLQFPRADHPVLKIEGNILLLVENYEGVGAEVTEPSTSFSFDIDIFPTSLTIKYKIGGNDYSVGMDDDGSINDSYVSGYCDRNRGRVELTFTVSPDVGSSITYSGDGYHRKKVKHETLEADPENVMEGFMNTGAVRCVGDDFDIISSITASHPRSGILEFENLIPGLPDTETHFYIIAPIHEDIKIAQLIQTAHIINPTGVFPVEGIRIRKIADTMVSFSDRILGYSRYVRMASRYGLHPAAFTRLIPYSIYGKAEVGVA